MNVVISCQELAALMASDALFAVFDVRERGEFNECQITNATSLPRSQIEFRIAQLVPNPKVQIVVYDEGDARAPLAAATLIRLGYEQVSILERGLGGWREEGRPTVSGVNVPSKAFGEKVHHEQNIPDVTPQELKALRESAANLVILDVRTPEEYGRFCIPGGINVPGGDLILWATELKHRSDATVIVNCAGRTRSIIGTAALRRLGLSHARALRNGTMGWVLAGMDLETKPQRTTPPAPADSGETANSLARQLAAEEGIRWIAADATAALLGRAGDGVSYFIDVRSESEFESGHLPQSFNVPGGQAVQRTDDFVAVRNARIVFISAESARAVMAAYWYQQMGFSNVYVLQGGLRAWVDSGAKLELGPLRDEPLGLEAAKQAAHYVDAKALLGKNHGSALILDVGTSAEHEIAHVPGARWISRGWIDIKLPELFPDRTQPMLLTCPDGQNSVFAAQTLKDLGYVNVSVLNDGVRGWSAAGLDTEKGLEGHLVEPNDVVVSPSIRGNKEDMQRYLDWELKLHS